MNTDQFIANVQNACANLDPDAIHQCTLIVLDSLAEHLPLGQTKDMADQLPDEIGEAIQRGGNLADKSGVPIALDDFYGKLMFRTELGEDDAKTLARAVAQTLEKALSEGEAQAMVRDFPGQLDQLFGADQ